MGYLFLSLCLISGAIKGFCGKKISGKTEGYREAILANTVRMILCTFIGLFVIVSGNNLSEIIPDTVTLLISLMSGIFTAIWVVTWLLSVKKGAYMLVEIFMMLSILVPVVSGIFIFGTQVRLNQWIGITVLFIATLFMCSYNKSLKGNMSASALILMTICGLSSGLVDLSQKLFAELSSSPASVFNFYTYIISGTVMLIVYKAGSKSSTGEDKPINKLKSIFVYILIMAVCLFANSFFKTKAASLLTPARLYPLVQGAGLVIGMLMARFAFGEKLHIKAIIGIILSIISIIIINFL